MRIIRSKSCSSVLGQATGQHAALLRHHPAYDFRLLAALVVRAEQEAAQVSAISASTFLPRAFMICASFWNARLIPPSTHQLVSDALEAQSSTLSQSRMPRSMPSCRSSPGSS